ncbi:hypothetical protein C2G38_2173859 [Gigaspora rosea]|uniref:Uncharacterized protein n=1 Tax=Gigaspora rosea TaxID=44941 RepID=A0A397VJ20_9GLOM|nr:hypothetical protein C2G38_2173859 [Gigaspora rosea]
MSKRPHLSIKLISLGIFLYPIRIGWQTVFEQNNKRFYMHITGHESSEAEPEYRSQSGSNYSNIEATSSLAITSLYHKLFSNSKTKFSGPYILGWDDSELLELSLEGVQFRPFAFKIEKFLLYVISLGIGSNIEMMGAGIKYMSSFIGEFKKKRKNPNDVWTNVGLYKKFRGTQLFGLEHSLTQKIINNQHKPTCTPDAWNDEILMNNIPILELREKLQQLYPSQYVFSERKLCAWRTLLKASGCTNITPFKRDQSEYEFWSRSSTSHIDQNILQFLHDSGFLHTIPNYISSKTIAKARTYYNINGPGCLIHNKTTITRVRISEESEKQFENFFSDKNIVNLSSYKVDKYGLPLKYIKDQKETFYKNDLGSLCLTCAEYGYNTFDNLKELIKNKIEHKGEQNLLGFPNYELLGSDLSDYELLNLVLVGIMHISSFGYTSHVEYLEHCLQNAFGQCLKPHRSNCKECNKVSKLLTSRKTYLNTQFNANLLTLDKDGAIIVVDYKMKILPKSAHKVKSDFYGKSGCPYIQHYIKPSWIKIILDNGDHYHCSKLMSIIANWKLWYDIEIAHAIKCYVRLGYNINEEENIVEAIKNIKSTSVANIQPNRNKNIKKPKLSRISNWFEFKWPIEGEYIGFICAQALHHFGAWNNFSPAVISKSRDEVEQPRPSPKASDYTIMNSSWIVPVPSNKLDQRGLSYNAEENKTNLISLLKVNVQQETSNMIKKMKDTHMAISDEVNDKITVESKKRRGKHMTETIKEILKSFFHAGDEDKSERYMAKEMHQDLQQRVQMGELEAEEIPQLKTIENWISRYSSLHKKEVAKNAKASQKNIK